MTDLKTRRLEAGARFEEKGRPDKALQEYQLLLQELPDDLDALRAISDLLIRGGQRTEAVPVLFRLGALLARAGAHLKAVSTFRTVLKLDPQCVDAVRYLVDLMLKLGMAEDAKKYLLEMAELSEQLGLTSDRLGIFRKLVELEPDNIVYTIKLAEMCSSQGLLPEAIQHFRRATQALREQGRLQEYLKVAERLLRHQPSDTTLAKELANIYIQMGDRTSALRKLHLAHKQDSTDTETLLMLSNLFLQMLQPDKAIHILKVMAAVHRQQGSVDGAQQAYRRVLQLDPNDGDARKFFGS
jgi:tetratricopeptide (TPR) repeat protein